MQKPNVHQGIIRGRFLSNQPLNTKNAMSAQVSFGVGFPSIKSTFSLFYMMILPLNLSFVMSNNKCHFINNSYPQSKNYTYAIGLIHIEKFSKTPHSEKESFCPDLTFPIMRFYHLTLET